MMTLAVMIASSLAIACGVSTASLPDDGYRPDPEPPHASVPAPQIALEGDAGSLPAAPALVSVDVAVEADTILIGGPTASKAWCDGANHAGMFDVLNVGTGIDSSGAFRFALAADLAAIVVDPARAATVELVLNRAQTSPSCGSGPCPSACGSVTAFGLRSDWDEGAIAASYDGADWCRRTKGKSGTSWEAPGASGPHDRGAEAGSTALCESGDTLKEKTELRIPLALGAIATWLDASTHQLSILVQPGSGGVFTAVAREGTGTPARLHVTYTR